jgi:hypothetical protein
VNLDFQPERNAVVIHDEGLLSGELFGRWLRELTVDPDFDLEMHQIFDLSNMTGLPATRLELEKFALVATGYNQGTGRIAVVVPGGLAKGLAQAVEAMSIEKLGRELGVFETLEDALAWADPVI